jgi:hypothetical protein
MYNTSGKYYTATLPVLECENSGNYTIEVDNCDKDGVNKVKRGLGTLSIHI